MLAVAVVRVALSVRMEAVHLLLVAHLLHSNPQDLYLLVVDTAQAEAPATPVRLLAVLVGVDTIS